MIITDKISIRPEAFVDYNQKNFIKFFDGKVSEAILKEKYRELKKIKG